MNKFKLIILLALFPTYQTAFAQDSSDQLLWDPIRKLTVNDFTIKTSPQSASTSFGQFSFDFQMKGFDIFSKSLNKSVRNYFLPGASWIDTTANVNKSLVYQQTLFDISEIYARQFRKALKENRKQLVKGSKYVDGLNAHYMSEVSKRRLAYDSATNYAANAVIQKEWELQIQKELADLEAYAYDK
jgi:hypothetical protein